MDDIKKQINEMKKLGILEENAEAIDQRISMIFSDSLSLKYTKESPDLGHKKIIEEIIKFKKNILDSLRKELCEGNRLKKKYREVLKLKNSEALLKISEFFLVIIENNEFEFTINYSRLSICYALLMIESGSELWCSSENE